MDLKKFNFLLKIIVSSFDTIRRNKFSLDNFNDFVNICLEKLTKIDSLFVLYKS